jgi:hypothetical protein
LWRLPGTEGKSISAIAKGTGVSREQVRRDIAASGDMGASPEMVAGQDGKTYPASSDRIA